MNGVKIILNSTVNWLLASVLLSLLVSGCATMGKKECLNAQWQNVGYEDGAKGYNASRIGTYRKSCAEYDISPNLAAYTKGRQQGLAEWCTPSNGYYQGTRGASYKGVCPKALESDFELAMSQGRAVYDYQKKIRNQEKLIARLKGDYNATEEQISSLEKELIGDQAHPQRRRVLLDDIRAAETELELLQDNISEADFVLSKMRRNLNKMKTKMG